MRAANDNGKLRQFAMTAVFKGLGITADSQKFTKTLTPPIFTAPTTQRILEYERRYATKTKQSLSDIVKNRCRLTGNGFDNNRRRNSVLGYHYGYDCDTDGKVVSAKCAIRIGAQRWL